MHRIRRTATAVAAAAALALSPVAVGSADAKPPAKSAKATKSAKALKAAKAKASKTAKGKSAKAKANAAAAKAQVKQLINDVAVRDRALAQVKVSATMVGLPDDHEAVLVASIEADRLALAAIRDAGVANPATAPTARVEVRSFRVEVYTQAAGIVRDAVELAPLVVDDVEVAALVDLALQSALLFTSLSPKTDVEAARQLLVDAAATLVPVDEDPVVEEPVDEQPVS